MNFDDIARKVGSRRLVLAGIAALVLPKEARACGWERRCNTITQCFNQNQGRCNGRYGALCAYRCSTGGAGTQMASYRCLLRNTCNGDVRCDTQSSVCRYLDIRCC